MERQLRRTGGFLVGGGDTPSPTPPVTITISLKQVIDGQESDFEPEAIIESGAKIRARISQPLTFTEEGYYELRNSSGRGLLLHVRDHVTMALLMRENLVREETDRTYEQNVPWPTNWSGFAEVDPGDNIEFFDMEQGQYAESTFPDFNSVGNVSLRKLNYNMTFGTAVVDGKTILTDGNGAMIVNTWAHKRGVNFDDNNSAPIVWSVPDGNVWICPDGYWEASFSKAALQAYVQEHGSVDWRDTEYVNQNLQATVNGLPVLILNNSIPRWKQVIYIPQLPTPEHE